ncbi:MAG: phosphoribosylformylglycinamidine synthase subunit PurS [Bernardetiaceae bacterium]|nr:phosphoribosylformylglycinamidine synthase subunit PurS [Bernardetiaceae bacterium]
MKFRAEIDVMPLQELLDPQGKAVHLGLSNLGIKNVKDVRIGKHISIEIEADTQEEAQAQVDTACKKLLANPVMEYYECMLIPMLEAQTTTHA